MGELAASSLLILSCDATARVTAYPEVAEKGTVRRKCVSSTHNVIRGR